MTTAKAATRPARKTAARKAVSASQTSVKAVEADDPQNTAGWTFTRPVGAAEFVSTGNGPALSKLTPRALENLTELATDGNTNTARKYWIRVLSRHGVTVPFVPVADSE